MKSNILKFPTTKGDKWRRQAANELKRLANIIENDLADPQIHGFVIALQQGDEFVFGGCGELTKEERKVMTNAYYGFLDAMRKAELQRNT